MIFAFKFGLAAVTAGVAWYTNRTVKRSLSEWEGKVEYYDYTKGEIQNVESVMGSDNGRIVDMKICYKDAGGSVGVPLTRLIDHLALVVKTDKNEYWSLEKNSKVIHIQKGDKENDVLQKLAGERRDTPLIYSYDKHRFYLKQWTARGSISDNLGINAVRVNDVVNFICRKEVNTKFSFVNNCQTFIRGVLNFIHFGIPTSLSLYDYSWNRPMDVAGAIERQANNYVVELMLLHHVEPNVDLSETGDVVTKEFVGLLVKDNKGFYWSFEQYFDKMYIQVSRDKDIISRRLNGEDRLRSSTGMPRVIEVFSPYPTYSCAEIGLNKITNDFINHETFRTFDQSFIKDLLKCIYYHPRGSSTIMGLHDYTDDLTPSLIMDIFTDIPDNVTVSEVSLWSKLAQAAQPSEARHDLCLVILLETSNRHCWSLERVDNQICLQRSGNKISLIDRISGVLRGKKLEDCNAIKLIEKRISFRGLLRFVIDFQDILSNNENENFIESTLGFLGFTE